MNFDRMRALLLDQAIRGELVPQLAKEGEVDQIGAVPEQVPFAIPEKWKWVRLSDLVLKHLGGGTPSKLNVNFWNGDIPWASVKDLKGTVLSTTQDSITEEGLNNSSSNLIPAGTVIVCTRMGLGKVAINTVPVAINQDLRALFLSEKIDKNYFLHFYSGMKIEGAGTTVKGIKLTELLNLLIPLPPVEEQIRIVAKLEETFAEIDRAEKAYEELQTLASVLRGQILQKAIQGQLVTQLDTEPSVEMIGDAPVDVPFAIPEKWKWVKLKSVFSMQAGKFISASSIQPEGKYPCYGGNGLRGYVDVSNRKGRFPLIGRQGALCGNVHVVDGDFYATEHAVVVDCREYGDPDCVGLFLEAMNLNQYATATAQPGLSVKKIVELPFPLPPKDEQVRIVSKVKDLMKQVDALSAK